MTICMAKTIKEERLKWILPVVKKKVRIRDVARVCPYSTRSLERWVATYKKYGEVGLEPKSTEPKRYRIETPIRIKERVVEIRKKTKKCALKIHWQLEKEGILIHERTVGKILKKEKLVRKYHVRKIKYKYIKAQRQPGELVEIDVKYVPGHIANKRYFQYTAIDTASRWRYLDVYSEQTNYHSVLFLEDVIKRFEYKIQSVKTDNGMIFTNRYVGSYKRSDLSSRRLHAFDVCCVENNIVHYLIDPGKPAQNGTVERSHREDQEKFYDHNKFKNADDLKQKMKVWNDYYNNLEHCGLNGKSPNEFLLNYKKTNPPNVCT
jgi:transposase InsO family protein